MKQIELRKIEVEKTFEVAGIEFIKFLEKDGVTTAVAKDIVFRSEFGKANNDFNQSYVLDRLTKEILPKIAEAVGIENICDITTDLTTLDGLKPYKNTVSKISIPTFDFYRENVAIFDKYKLDSWWWLATPDSAEPHCKPSFSCCVTPGGRVLSRNYDGNLGVRPVLNFVSTIVVSCGD